MTWPQAVTCNQRDVDLGVGVEVWLRDDEVSTWRELAKADGKSVGAWITSKVASFVELVREYSAPLTPELVELGDSVVPSKNERGRNWVNRITSSMERGPVAQEVEDLVTWGRSVQRRAKAEAGFVYAPHPLSSSKTEQVWWGSTPPPSNALVVRLSGTQLVHWSRLATVSGFPDLARWLLAATRVALTVERWKGWKPVALLETRGVAAWGSAVTHGGENADRYLNHPADKRPELVGTLATGLRLSGAVLAVRGTCWVER